MCKCYTNPGKIYIIHMFGFIIAQGRIHGPAATQKNLWILEVTEIMFGFKSVNYVIFLINSVTIEAAPAPIFVLVFVIGY